MALRSCGPLLSLAPLASSYLLAVLFLPVTPAAGACTQSIGGGVVSIVCPDFKDNTQEVIAYDGFFEFPLPAVLTTSSGRQGVLRLTGDTAGCDGGGCFCTAISPPSREEPSQEFQ